jgi:hypothetical protein
MVVVDEGGRRRVRTRLAGKLSGCSSRESANARWAAPRPVMPLLDRSVLQAGGKAGVRGGMASGQRR